MGKRILMTVLGVLLGGLGGTIVMMACHFATMPLYPPPEGLDIMDPAQEEAVHAWMATLPGRAFLVAAICHWIGTAAGAAIAMLITGRRSTGPALIVGALFTVAGITNLVSVPHPAWFPYVDLPGYLLVAALVGKWLVRTPSAVEMAPNA